MAASTWRCTFVVLCQCLMPPLTVPNLVEQAAFNPRTDPEVLDITPADKRTFTRLNNGHGRLLKGAQSVRRRLFSLSIDKTLQATTTQRISSSAHSEPHTVTRGSRVWSARDEDVMPGSGSRPLSSPSPMAGTEPAEAKALSPDDRRTSSPAGLAETSATSTVGMIPTLEVATFLRGHIIICGAPSGLQHFITPLRTSTSVVRGTVAVLVTTLANPRRRSGSCSRLSSSMSNHRKLDAALSSATSSSFLGHRSTLTTWSGPVCCFASSYLAWADPHAASHGAGIETASMAVVLSHQSQVGFVTAITCVRKQV